MKALRTKRESSTAAVLLEEAYIHLTSKRHTTRSLAQSLGVSVPTAFRVIRALRGQGLRIESMKEGREWYFAVFEDEQLAKVWRDDPLLRLVGSAKGSRRRGQSVDDAVYGRK